MSYSLVMPRALFWFASRSAQAEAPARTDPPQPRRGPPVFIHDAITPWRGETLLSARLRAELEAACKETDAAEQDRASPY